MANTSYETVIGLEVHLQLKTATKVFCGCPTIFGQKPNTQTCPVCLGLPGSLPVLNEEAFYYAVRVALALNGKIQELIKFDRKNYYYPDLPKNFQISQYDMPLSYDGCIDLTAGPGGDRKRVRIKRVHLEEDAGKLIHPQGERHSLVDYNRTGMPLLEIVTEPDINTPDEAYDYLTRLKAILEYLKVSDCDMEKGSLRCDANISVRTAGEKKLGTKVELKNMNTFKGVRAGLAYEAERQSACARDQEPIIQETRLWDADKGVTVSMRVKEEATDYRYFPEPDLVPFIVDRAVIEAIRAALPELPEAKARRFVTELGLSEYDAGVITSQYEMAGLFERTAGVYQNRKAIANWIMGDITAYCNEENIRPAELGITPDGLAGLLKMIDGGTISGKMAKDVLLDALTSKRDPAEIVAAKGLSQISDAGKLDSVVEAILGRNEKSVSDYKSGKKNALAHLMGQVMKETKGAANPAMVNELLKKKLGG